MTATTLPKNMLIAQCIALPAASWSVPARDSSANMSPVLKENEIKKLQTELHYEAAKQDIVKKDKH